MFDRDDGRLRIVEDVVDLFGQIGSQAHARRADPASPTKGWDFIVEVAWVPFGSGTDTVWQVVVLPDTAKGVTPFTKEELEVLGDPRLRREELENRHFVKESPDGIRRLWSLVAPP